MLPREFVEELISWFHAARLYVLEPLPHRLDGFLIVVTLPIEMFGQHVVEGIGGRLSTSTRKLLERGEPVGRDRHRRHAPKIETR